MRLLVLVALLCAPSAAMADCLDYGVPVTLTGTYATEMFYGAPYGDPEAGAELEEHRFVDLNPPICMNDGADLDFDYARGGIDRVELMPACPSASAGQTLTVSGRLFGEMTFHHKAPVLIDCPAE